MGYALEICLYVFVGINVGQLINLVDHARDEYTYDNRILMGFLWLPIMVVATIEHLYSWKQKQLSVPVISQANQFETVWQSIRRDWLQRGFPEPTASEAATWIAQQDTTYPWENHPIEATQTEPANVDMRTVLQQIAANGNESSD
jgi:hypothetical protein